MVGVRKVIYINLLINQKISNKGDYKELIENIKNDQNSIYLDNDYVRASELTNRVSYTKDVAKTLSRLKMQRNYRSLNAQVTEVYFLYPEESYGFAKKRFKVL